MPAPKEPTTFDGYLGSLIADSARRKGGRPFIAQLIGVSKKTIDRRALGDGSYTVKEMHLIADALNTTATELVERALRDYANGTVEEGVAKLIADEGLSTVDESRSPAREDPVPLSDEPASLDAQRRKKKPSEMSEEELDAFEGEFAANTDPELGRDEPETT